MSGERGPGSGDRRGPGTAGRSQGSGGRSPGRNDGSPETAGPSGLSPKRSARPRTRPGPGAIPDGPRPLPGPDDSVTRRRTADEDDRPRRSMEKIGDLLPRTAREYGLEDELELANLASAWLRIVAERIPAAGGSCRVIGLSQGVATIEADEPIVAQEIRLRSPELTAALRSATTGPIRQLRISLRHV